MQQLLKFVKFISIINFIGGIFLTYGGFQEQESSMIIGGIIFIGVSALYFPLKSLEKQRVARNEARAAGVKFQTVGDIVGKMPEGTGNALVSTIMFIVTVWMVYMTINILSNTPVYATYSTGNYFVFIATGLGVYKNIIQKFLK
jgi:hypothetical protein